MRPARQGDLQSLTLQEQDVVVSKSSENHEMLIMVPERNQIKAASLRTVSQAEPGPDASPGSAASPPGRPPSCRVSESHPECIGYDVTSVGVFRPASRPGKMEVLTLVLVFATVPGFSSVLNLRPILMEVRGLSGMKAGVSISAEVNETLEPTETEAFTPETNAIKSGEKTAEERKREDGRTSKTTNVGEIQDRDEGYRRSSEETLIPETSESVKEERERKLVAGIHLHEARGDTYEVEKIPTLTREREEEAGKVEEIIKITHNDNHIEVRSLTEEERNPGIGSEDVTVREVSVKPAERGVNTTGGAEEGGFVSTLEAAKPKPDEAKRRKSSPPTHFPYFKDDFCPAECSCYGRVVQCSDKGIDQIPYGIPYNARYVLLMNNRIGSIQLDLLSEYVSMEFLVLSNNELTDGTLEGAFEGIPALKRLYLDRNLLESVPVDLPVSLEELRLDNNHLRLMSAAAWERCPGLSVLDLSNNSLGNGSGSLPDGALSALPNLRTLNLGHNKLSSVPLGLPLSVKVLYLRGNLIETFRRGVFNGISGLVVLDLSANRLTNKGLLGDSLLNATHLESLNLEGNRLKQVPRHLPPSLKTLNLEGNLISSVKKSTFSSLKNMEHLGLARNKIFRVAPGAFRTLAVLHQLDLGHNALRQVPRHLPQGLHSVDLAHNRIRAVPRDSFCWGEESLSGLVRVQLEHNLMDMGNLDTRPFRCLRGFQVVHFH
ncbi:wu:fc23c09 [Cololabis saira]|uniref:wu:fc23c09 n=1 Tax=Cololabis saira TaxID=129043 RepID=UPI002AD45921|nr:wu:fc23c09 [Cololabis saira]